MSIQLTWLSIIVAGTMSNMRNRILAAFIMAVIVIGLLASLVWYIMKRRMNRKLSDMSRITEKMSRLEFDEKVDFHSKDELGRLAESIDRMSDELRESIDRMQTELERRENLVRNLTHDIRTPVTVIKGYSESLAAFYPTEDRVSQYVEIIVDECDRLTKMSEDMLEFFAIRDRKDYYRMEMIDTGDLFRDFVRRLKNIHPSRTVLVDYDIAHIMVDQGLIERAVYNLMENAVKHGKEDGVIRLLGKREKEHYRFSVSNEGDSIDQKDLKYIWDAFYKADKSRKRDKGYGIGLSIVREIAVFHGGDVEISSKGNWNVLSFTVSLDHSNMTTEESSIT